MFVWQDGDESEAPYVLIDGTKHYIVFTVRGETEVSAANLNQAQEELQADIETELSEQFNVNTNYLKGKLCIKDNVVYKANQDITAGPWNSTQWTVTTITAELENRLEFEVVEEIT